MTFKLSDVWAHLSHCSFFYVESGKYDSYVFFLCVHFFFFSAPGFHTITQAVGTWQLFNKGVLIVGSCYLKCFVIIRDVY